jgi:hypothetical protein
MANQVKVTSIDVLEAFRADLIVFLNKGHQSVDEVGDAIRRMRLCLQNDWRVHWEGELRRRNRVLAQAQQELLSAKLSGLRDSVTMQENAVRKGKAAVAEAEEKLRNVKTWNRDFDHTVGPLVKKLDGLRQVFDHDMPKALSFLVQAQKTLDAYTDIGAPRSAAAPAATPANSEEQA